ncbi:multidrug ABC transporter permease, partial [bacterium]|nr:multidrug ABC transporter permease [bacterium]
MKVKNLQVIYVMWLREMKRFLRAKSRVIGSLAMPFFFLLSMGMGFNSGFNLQGVPQGTNYLDFLVPGI